MLQPTRVLPSNAPPLQEGGDGLHQATRVLQEHSGNRQQQQHEHCDLNSSTPDWRQAKYLYETQQNDPANILTGESAYARHHVPNYQPQHHHQHRHLYHPRPRHRQAWRYGYRGTYGPDDEARIQDDAERLYARFRKSEAYVKYRTKQSKDDKGNGDQKWPDHLEKAFFRALITYPPMGRRKQLHKEKQRGRNELIADCIEELTGEARTRKQVSSHIQVLKPFVEHDREILRWLSKEDMQAQQGRYHSHSYACGRRMSNYPVTAPPHSMRSSMMGAPRGATAAYEWSQLKQSPQAFEPVDFQMFIQRKYKDAGHQEKVNRVHIYSEAVPNPLDADRAISDWQTLALHFPLLAKAHQQRPLDCTVLIAEASLAFPTVPMEKLKGREGAEIELGIFFQCRSRQLPAPRAGMKSAVSLVNKFFERGQEATAYSDHNEVYFHTAHDSNAGVGTVEAEVKFGSTFWAATLGSLGNKMRQAVEMDPQQRAKIADYVRSLSALQEVYVCEERIVVIHWNFRLSNKDKGRASWRRLALPDASATSAAAAGIYTTPHQPRALKTDRADSFYDYADSLGDLTHTTQYQAQQPLPTLQSPFDYDTSNSSADSALSSATWTTSLSDASVIGDTSTGDFGADNTFDFNAGNINIAYDPNLNFDTFDSSAFNFDDAAVDADFAADPALQDFSQQSWYDGVFETNSNVAHHGLSVNLNGNVGEGTSFDTQPDLDTANQIYVGYDAEQFNSQAAFEAPPTPHHGHQQQAFGGAGPEVVKEDDALAALGDTSAWASGMGGK